MDDLDNKIPPTRKLQIPVVVPGAAGSRTAARAQEKAKRKAQAQQRLLFILLGFALVINLVIAYFLYGTMVQNATLNNIQEAVNREVDSRISIAQLFLTDNQQKLDDIAKNLALVQALKEKNKDAFPVLINSFSAQFDRPLAFSIFIADEADINSEGTAPIRFAELDLIRRNEHREKSYPEAALINEKWQIHFVSPISPAPDQPVLGSLMLTLDSHQLDENYLSVDKTLGESLLQQKFNNAMAQNIIRLGTANSNKSYEKEIPGSNWQIKFTPSDELLRNAEESPTLYIFVLGCIVALSLSIVLVLSRFLVRFEKKSEKSLAENVIDTAKAAASATPVADQSLTSTLYQTQDILDIAVIDEDENILGLNDISNKKQSSALPEVIDDESVPVTIFRSYDIRGVYEKELTAELAERIGQAVGSEALDQGEQALIVARDGRTHGQELTTALIKGILRSGCNVVNIGLVPTPLMYFATYHFDDVRSGVMVTASHNPAEYNGFKVVINNNALADEGVMNLRSRILNQRVHQGTGEETFREIIPHYIERIFSDVALANNVSIVVDAGNAVPGLVAPQLFEELGCEVIPLYCDLDGTFPNHDPDPTQENNLFALIEKVKEVNADIGVAFDGDGDRLVVVTPRGDIIWPDRLLMLFARDILARNPGADILFDVKCSRQLNQVISGYGGRPIMWKTGHSPMKAKMLETGALIGGEYSGHIFIKDRWYGFDDGIYAMARLLEIITLRDQKIDDIFAAFPQLVTTPEIKVALPDKTKFDFMKKLIERADFQNGNITTIDGIRVDYSKGWGLVRASNTSPALTLRFEAESQEALEKIQQVFKRELLKVDGTLALKF